jgi:hypothetical protein
MNFTEFGEDGRVRPRAVPFVFALDFPRPDPPYGHYEKEPPRRLYSIETIQKIDIRDARVFSMPSTFGEMIFLFLRRKKRSGHCLRIRANTA